MLEMYDTHSGFQPTNHYKLLEKPLSKDWEDLNYKEWDNRKHWLCFHLPERGKTFNVYYPLSASRGERITILVDTNNPKDEWDIGLFQIEWIEGQIGLFEREIKPKLLEWIHDMQNLNTSN